MSPTKTVRVGIAGSGFAARFQYAALLKVHGGKVPGLRVEVSGVWSPNAANRQKIAQDRGTPEHASLEALCDASDLITACVPGSVHESVACTALGRGKHVIIEKPFTGYYGAGTADFRKIVRMGREDRDRAEALDDATSSEPA